MNTLTIRNFDDLERQATIFVRSGMFQDTKDVSQAMVKIQAGAEMGVAAFASMNGFVISRGKLTMLSGLMAALILRSDKYDFRVVEFNTKQCVLDFYKLGEKQVGVSFTMEDATRAGLPTGPNAHSWKKYPAEMLYARAISRLARRCPDVFSSGTMYIPEELGDTPEVIEGEFTKSPPANLLPSPTQLNGKQASDQYKASLNDAQKKIYTYGGNFNKIFIDTLMEAQKHYKAINHVTSTVALLFGEEWAVRFQNAKTFNAGQLRVAWFDALCQYGDLREGGTGQGRALRVVKSMDYGVELPFSKEVEYAD